MIELSVTKWFFMCFGVNVVFCITKDDKKNHCYNSLFRNVDT